MTSSREHAQAQDVADPLRAFHDSFMPSNDTAIYADGNSLGPPPRATAVRLAAAVEEWADVRVGGWDRWLDVPFEVGDRLGAACLGARPGQVAVCDSTSINLFKAVSAALDAAPHGHRRLVVSRDEFPTDRYLLESIAAQRGVEVRFAESGQAAIDACDGTTAVVVVSAVNYRSGELLDLVSATAHVHNTGAEIVWDLSHAVGVVPLRLDMSGVNLAVGCTYKYLNSGPGAPAFVYVAHAVQKRLRQPLWGWFGQRDQFAMGAAYEPADGMRSWLVGTPNIIGTTAVDEGVRLIAAAGIDAIRAKSLLLTQSALDLAEEHLVPLGWSVETPRPAERRGGHVALSRPNAEAVCAALIERRLVVPDFRAPNVLRLGYSPLLTRFADVFDSIAAVAEVTVSLA